MAQVNRDSFAGAACAGPKAKHARPATRAKPALDDKSKGEMHPRDFKLPCGDEAVE